MVCETLQNPQQSDIFHQVDQVYLQPVLSKVPIFQYGFALTPPPLHVW